MFHQRLIESDRTIREKRRADILREFANEIKLIALKKSIDHQIKPAATKNSKESPQSVESEIFEACASGNLAKVQELLTSITADAAYDREKHGLIKSVGSFIPNGWTVLHFACWPSESDRRAIVKAILESPNKPSNVNEQDEFGYTALHYACMDSLQPENVVSLVETGKADLELKTHLWEQNDRIWHRNQGLTGVMLASHFGLHQTLEYLLKNGASIQARTGRSETALAMAGVGLGVTEESRRKTIEMLHKYNATF